MYHVSVPAAPEGPLLAWIEIKASAFNLLAIDDRSSSLMNTSVSRVRCTLNNGFFLNTSLSFKVSDKLKSSSFLPVTPIAPGSSSLSTPP
ncbi:hypothetical protein D3C72_2231850 [compost metagenome]